MSLDARTGQRLPWHRHIRPPSGPSLQRRRGHSAISTRSRSEVAIPSSIWASLSARKSSRDRSSVTRCGYGLGADRNAAGAPRVGLPASRPIRAPIVTLSRHAAHLPVSVLQHWSARSARARSRSARVGCTGTSTTSASATAAETIDNAPGECRAPSPRGHPRSPAAGAAGPGWAANTTTKRSPAHRPRAVSQPIAETLRVRVHEQRRAVPLGGNLSEQDRGCRLSGAALEPRHGAQHVCHGRAWLCAHSARASVSAWHVPAGRLSAFLPCRRGGLQQLSCSFGIERDVDWLVDK